MCSLGGAIDDLMTRALVSVSRVSDSSPCQGIVLFFWGKIPLRCINVYRRIFKYSGQSCDGLASQRGVKILQVVSCYRSWDALRPDGPLAPVQTLPFTYSNSFFLFVNRFQAGQRSSLDSLLNFLKTKLYSQAINEKNPVRRILFIVAESTILSSEKLTALPAKNLHDNGIEVFLLTVGKHVTNNEPNKVASKPLKTHLFRVNSYSDLPRLSKAFKGKGKLFLDSHIFVYFYMKGKRKVCLSGGLDDF